MNAKALVAGLAVLSFSVSSATQSSFTDRKEFPIPIGASLSVAPSGETLAIVTRFSCDLFAVSEDGARWLGPFSAPNGGLFGTQSDPKVNMEARRSLSFPFYTWIELTDGTDALLLDPVSNRSVTTSLNEARETTTPSTVEWELLDRQTRRLRKTGMDVPGDLSDRIQSAYLDIKGSAPATVGFITPSTARTIDLPDVLYGIADFSPSHDRVLCRPREGDPLFSINVHTGERIPFPIHRSDRGLSRFISGSFSPDGEHVLVQFSYGPDGHYGGGFLLLFTKQGRFVEEVTEFHEDVGQPVGFHEWLNNNWIVYSTGKELVFRKFTAD